MYPPVLHRLKNDIDHVVSGDHAKYLHLHFDVNGVVNEVKSYFEPFITSENFNLGWQDFSLPLIHELEEMFQRAKIEYEESILRKVVSSTYYGAPTAHLSARKFHGSTLSQQFQEYIGLYQRGISFVTNSPFSGYIELEDVYMRQTIRPTCNALKNKYPPATFPIPNIQKKPLNDRTIQRSFRTTEVHITFEDIRFVELRILAILLGAGFYSAFLLSERADTYKFIATIQGFDPDIFYIFLIAKHWLLHEVEKGNVSTQITMKKEDILSYCIFGSERVLQEIVCPETLSLPLSFEF